MDASVITDCGQFDSVRESQITLNIMKCGYYSIYPYKAPDRKIVEESRDSKFAMPFRLYFAAECENLGETTEEDFVRNCFEAMDRPDVRMGLDLKKMPESYVDDYYQVKVYPKKHFYGATNTLDGIYVVDSKHYIVDDESVCECCSWENAVDVLWKMVYRHYTEGTRVEYKPMV